MLVDSKERASIAYLSEARGIIMSTRDINTLLDVRLELARCKEDFPAITARLIKDIDQKLTDECNRYN
jgi:hypothetical protein